MLTKHNFPFGELRPPSAAVKKNILLIYESEMCFSGIKDNISTIFEKFTKDKCEPLHRAVSLVLFKVPNNSTPGCLVYESS